MFIYNKPQARKKYEDSQLQLTPKIEWQLGKVLLCQMSLKFCCKCGMNNVKA